MATECRWCVYPVSKPKSRRKIKNCAKVTDPILTAIVEELVEVIATLPTHSSVLALTHTIAPRLAAVIDTPPTSETIHLPGEAVQLANSMTRTRGGPIEDEFVSTVSVAVMKCLVRTDDMDVIQVGSGIIYRRCR
jgi:hypothetical protein